jgi:hypothetical protein
MRRIYTALLAAFVSVFFVQCQKEISTVGSTPNSSIDNLLTPSPVTANIQGNVFNESNLPAAGVSITVGAKTAVTDANGYFRISNASLDKNASLVVAQKSGYFKALRSFSATSGTNQVTIKLIKKTLTGTVSATAGGDVVTSNGTKVTLPANGIVVASTSAAYTGTVNAYISYIDPTATDIDQTIPGSYMANDKDGKRVMLTSFGMMAVELEGASGEKLQIMSGSKAILTMPIPSSAQGSAPGSIALWSVDESTGLWKEEGTAAKTGSSYIGEVAHFSFWNCDVSVPSVNLQLTLNNAAGQPLAHVQVRLKRISTTNGFNQTYGWTDSLGKVSGLVPANEVLQLDVMSLCGTSIYTQNIGPFAANTNLGVISVTGTTANVSLVTVKGKLLNCSNAPVTSGYAIVSFNNYVHYVSVDASGNFTTTYTTCSSITGSVQVLGIDLTTMQQSTTGTFTLTTPLTDVGNITACGVSAQQYINYTLDGVNYSITSASPQDSLTAYTSSQGTTVLSTMIAGSQSVSGGGNIYFTFTHPTATVGTYNIASISVQSFSGNTTVVSPSTVTLTNYPAAIGEFYQGTFAANFKDAQQVLHNVTGAFKLRKNF